MKWKDFWIWFLRILSVTIIIAICLCVFQTATTRLEYAFAAILTITLIHFWRYLFFKK